MEKITVYHGTNKTAFDELQKSKFQLIDYGSSKDRLPNDLGHGFYFYGTDDYFNGISSALNYVNLYRNKGSNHATIIEFELQFEKDELLNLDDPKQNEIILGNMKKLKNTVYKMGDLKHNRLNLDGIFFNLYLRAHNTIKVVKKRTFTPEIDKKQISNFPNGLEYCVKQHEVYTYISHKHHKIK